MKAKDINDLAASTTRKVLDAMKDEGNWCFNDILHLISKSLYTVANDKPKAKKEKQL